jgi:hypothetical protein
MANFLYYLEILLSALVVFNVGWSQSRSKPFTYLPKHIYHRLRIVWRVLSSKNIILVSHIEERVLDELPMLQYKTIAHTQYSDYSDATTLNTASVFYAL